MTINRNLSQLAPNVSGSGVLGVAGGGTGNTSSTGSGSLVLSNSPTLSNPVISGGTVNNVVIGGTTPAAASFTTATASTTLNVGGTALDAGMLAQFGNANPQVKIKSNNTTSGGAALYLDTGNTTDPLWKSIVGQSAGVDKWAIGERGGFSTDGYFGIWVGGTAGAPALKIDPAGAVNVPGTLTVTGAITGSASQVGGYAASALLKTDSTTTDLNNLAVQTVGMSSYGNDSTSNLPTSPSGTAQWWNTITIGTDTRRTQLAFQAYGTGNGSSEQNAFWLRSKHDTTFSAWRKVITSDAAGNVTLAGTLTATLSGTATTATNWGSYGAVPTAGAQVPANGIPRADVNGYMFFGFINIANAVENYTTNTVFYASTDNYLRKHNGQSFKTSLNRQTVAREGGNITLVAGTTYMVYGPGIVGGTMYLPASPVQGDTIRFIDMYGNWGTNSWTLNRNGQPIMGLAENMTVSTTNANFTLVYADASAGWRILRD